MNLPTTWALVALLFCSTGCKASVSADANFGGEDDLDEPLDPTLGADRAQDADSGGDALLGARQDLHFKGPATVHCRCVDVAIGQARDSAFEWSTTPPDTDPNSQLVIAIANASDACPGAPAESLGASYWGFETVGNDVVVVIEPAMEGRPITSGAVIPKPLGDGQVYLRPVSAKIPYGKSASGEDARCPVGNPGGRRVAAQAEPARSAGGTLRIGAPKPDAEDDAAP